MTGRMFLAIFAYPAIKARCQGASLPSPLMMIPDHNRHALLSGACLEGNPANPSVGFGSIPKELFDGLVMVRHRLVWAH